MNTEQFMLYLALAYGFISFTFSLLGLLLNHAGAVKCGYRAFLVLFFLLFLEVFMLFIHLQGHAFSYRYVTRYSSLTQQVYYNFAALWAGREGSMLFFTAILSFCAVGMLIFWKWESKKQRTVFVVFSSWLIGFLVFFLAFFEDPFRQFFPVPVNGSGLSATLRQPAMIFHPPAIYLGYALILITFSLFFAHLITRALKSGQYLSYYRIFLLTAWVALSIGNVLGMWWSYHELGWGGYWNWDPVECASLLPWLLLTAMLHLIKIMIHRHSWFFHSTLAFLVLFVSVMGSFFMTRTPLFYSIHSFSGRPNERMFTLLVVIFMILTVSYYLFVAIRDTDRFSRFFTTAYLAKDSLLFQSNILLYLISATVLSGLLAPLGIKILSGEEVAFTSQFYSSLTFPSLILLFVLLFFGLRDYQLKKAENYFYLGFFTLMSVLVVLYAWPFLDANVLAALGIFTCSASLMMFVVNFMKLFFPLQHVRWGTLNAAGTYLLHSGIVLFFLGVILSSQLSRVSVFPLSFKKNIVVYGSRFELNAMNSHQEGGAHQLIVRVIGYIEERPVLFKMVRHYYTDDRQTYTRAAVQRVGFTDYYLLLEDYNDVNNMIFTLHRRPFVCLVWIGACVAVIGAGFLMFPVIKKGA